MAVKKKGNKNARSKTDHVLNLITTTGEPSGESKPSDATSETLDVFHGEQTPVAQKLATSQSPSGDATQNPPPPVQAMSPAAATGAGMFHGVKTPVVKVVTSNDDVLSLQIQGALSDTLQAEIEAEQKAIEIAEAAKLAQVEALPPPPMDLFPGAIEENAIENLLPPQEDEEPPIPVFGAETDSVDPSFEVVDHISSPEFSDDESDEFLEEFYEESPVPLYQEMPAEELPPLAQPDPSLTENISHAPEDSAPLNHYPPPTMEEFSAPTVADDFSMPIFQEVEDTPMGNVFTEVPTAQYQAPSFNSQQTSPPPAPSTAPVAQVHQGETDFYSPPSFEDVPEFAVSQSIDEETGTPIVPDSPFQSVPVEELYEPIPDSAAEPVQLEEPLPSDIPQLPPLTPLQPFQETPVNTGQPAVLELAPDISVNPMAEVNPSTQQMPPATFGENERPSSPVMETPQPVAPPVVETPQPVAPPVMEPPQPVTPPVMDVPQPVAPPVVETPQPVAPPVMDVPQPVAPPVVEVPQPVAPPVVETPQPVAPPVVEVPQPVAPPVVETPQPVAPPVVEVPQPVAPPVVDVPQPVAPPVMEVPQPVAPPVMEVPQPVAPPVMEVPQPVAPPVLEVPQPVAPPVMEVPQPVAPPVLEVPQPVAPPVLEVPQPVAPPVVETPQPVAPPVVEVPQPVAPPVLETPQPVAPPVVDVPQPVAPPVMEVPQPVAPPVVETPQPVIEQLTLATEPMPTPAVAPSPVEQLQLAPASAAPPSLEMPKQTPLAAPPKSALPPLETLPPPPPVAKDTSGSAPLPPSANAPFSMETPVPPPVEPIPEPSQMFVEEIASTEVPSSIFLDPILPPDAVSPSSISLEPSAPLELGDLGIPDADMSFQAMLPSEPASQFDLGELSTGTFLEMETVMNDDSIDPTNPMLGRKLGEPIEYYNLSELLVRELAPRFLQTFGTCTCEQCLLDVIAHALSQVKPKYVVRYQAGFSEIAADYKREFSSAVVSQLGKSCIAINEKPRHLKPFMGDT